MRGRPAVATVRIDGLLWFVNLFLERVRGPPALPKQGLVIGGFVPAGFQVKCLLADRWQMCFFAAFEKFPVGPALGLASHGIVVGLQHPMNERDDGAGNLALVATIVIVGQEPEKAATIAGLGRAIPGV